MNLRITNKPATLALLLLLTLLAVLFVSSQRTTDAAGPVVASRVVRVAFASLGTPVDGSERYCTDCQATTPCTGSGSGAKAERVNGAWNCSDGGGVSGGATKALDNLASVNINTSLLPQTGVDAGSAAKPFRDLFLFGSGTYGTTSFRFTGTPTAARIFTLPDANSTFPIASQVLTFSGPTAARTFTFPDTSTTICATNAVCTGYQAALGYTAENTANKDATGGYAGLTLFKINFKNAANTFTSFFQNTNTAARTYTFQDSDDTIVGRATTDELTNKTLTSSVGKGTWTASGTWTLPAFTLGGTVSGGGQQLNNVIIGTTTPLAGNFTTVAGSGNITTSAGDGGFGTASPNLTSKTRAVTINGSADAMLELAIGGVLKGYLYKDANHLEVDAGAGYQSFNAGSAEQFRLAANGNALLQASAYTTCASLTTVAHVITCGASDARLKWKFSPYTLGLDAISKLRPRTYQFRPGTQYFGQGEYHSTLVAQNVQEAIPGAVSDIGNGTLQIDNAQIIATMVNAINELKADRDHDRKVVAAQQRIIQSLRHGK